MSTTENPHDSVVRQVLGRPEVAAGYFRHNLPAELAEKLDFSTLERVQDSFVDPELHPSASDLLFTVDYISGAAEKREQLLLYLLVEHKSYPDRMTLFQLLRYMVRVWERHCAENQKTIGLPPVYPLILYHGRNPWPYPLNFHSLISVDDPFVLRHLPEFSPVLHDVARLDDDEIIGEAAAGTLLLLPEPCSSCSNTSFARTWLTACQRCWSRPGRCCRTKPAAKSSSPCCTTSPKGRAGWTKKHLNMLLRTLLQEVR